jgi:hypothetical protein
MSIVPVTLSPVARVNFAIANNVWWDDALQFGVAGDTSWSFTGKSFLLDIKRTRSDASPLLSVNSTGGKIVVDDVALRILHFLVDDHTIRASLPVTECPTGLPYVYDLVMVDTGTGQRDLLMHGTIEVKQGVTVED